MSDSSRLQLSGLGASLSGPIAGLSDTPITEVAMTVFGDPDVVPLWFGEGDLVTPDFVRDAAAKGLQAGETFYTWQRGIPELRAALSAYTERLYGIKCPIDRISVTTGGMQAILLSCQLLLDPGDNIVIVSPIWPNITSAAKLVRGEPEVRGARPQARRRLEARSPEGVRRSRRAHARDLRQFARQSDGLDDDVGRAEGAARFCPQARRLDHGRRGLCPADLHAPRRALVPRAGRARTIRCSCSIPSPSRGR